MKNSTKIALGILIGLTFLGAGFGTAFADTGTSTASTTPNRMGSLVAFIAQRFNLAVADVQKAFNDFALERKSEREDRRAENESKREQAFSDQLTKAVADGKLTQAQADLVKTEITKVKAALEALKGKSKSEQRTALKALRDTEKSWAKTNNIPFGFLEKAFVGFKTGPELGKGHDKRGPPNATSTKAEQD